MLPQCSHITRKRGVYYFRRRLPSPMSAEVAVSLRTRNFREAEFLTLRLNARFNECIADEMTDYAKIAEVLRSELDHLNREAQRELLETPYGQGFLAVGYRGDPDGAVDADLEVCDELIGEYRADLSRRDLRNYDSFIRRLMKTHGIPDEDYQPFGLACLDMLVKNTAQIREWILKGPVALDNLPGSAAVNAEKQPNSKDALSDPKAPKLSAALPSFIELMTTTGEWKGQTEAQNKATYAMFLQHCGDRPVHTYTRKDCAAFFDVLRALPALYAKRAEWRGMSLADIADCTRGQNVERLTMKTIKRHFSALGRLFDYLKKRGEYEGENPAHGHEFPTGKTRANQH